MKTYFYDPRSPWQGVAIENTNNDVLRRDAPRHAAPSGCRDHDHE